MGQLLTDKDMRELTGYIHGSTQTRALEEMGFIRGVHFRIRPDGKPRITWAAMDPQKTASNEPKFELINDKET